MKEEEPLESALRYVFFLFSLTKDDLECLQLMERVHNWPDILSKFANIISTPNLIMGTITDTNDPTIPNTNEAMKATHSGSKEGLGLKRQIAVLQNLLACKGVTTSLINMQLAVISLHRLLNQVSL